MTISDPGRGLVRRLGRDGLRLCLRSRPHRNGAPKRCRLSIRRGAFSKNRLRRSDDRSPPRRPWRRRRWPGGGGGGSAAAVVAFTAAVHGGVPGGGAAFHGGGFRGGGMRSTVVAFAPRRVPRRRHRYGYRHVYHRPHFHRRHHFHRRFYAPLLRIPVLLWLPAPLLPRCLDLLRAAEDLPLSPTGVTTITGIIHLLVRRGG